MDFIEGIGERYLMGKANAAPQMLENLAKKQFASATNPKKAQEATQASSSSTLPSSDKDQEIAKLRKELAEMKLRKGKKNATGAAKSEHDQTPTRSKSLKSEKSKANDSSSVAGSEAKGNGGGAKKKKEMKGLAPTTTSSSIIRDHSYHDDHSKAPSNSGDRKTSTAVAAGSSSNRRGRSASISTATAAKAHKAPSSEAKSGGSGGSRPGPLLQGSKPGIHHDGLEEASLGGKETARIGGGKNTNSSRRRGTARDVYEVASASSAASSAHAPSLSSTNRRDRSDRCEIDDCDDDDDGTQSVSTTSTVKGHLLQHPQPPPSLHSHDHDGYPPQERNPTPRRDLVVRNPKERREDRQQRPEYFVVEVEEEEGDDDDAALSNSSSRRRRRGGQSNLMNHVGNESGDGDGKGGGGIVEIRRERGRVVYKV